MEVWKVRQSNGALGAFDAGSGKACGYARLSENAARVQAALPRPGRKSLCLMVTQNRYECLAALTADNALIILNASLNAELLSNFLAAYQPDWIFSAQSELQLAGYRKSASGEPGLLEGERPPEFEIHPDLVPRNLSGSTGSRSWFASC